MDEPRSTIRDEVDAWWALLSRILSFLLGSLIAYNLQKHNITAFWPWAVAAAMMGPVVVAGLAEIARAMTRKGKR